MAGPRRRGDPPCVSAALRLVLATAVAVAAFCGLAARAVPASDAVPPAAPAEQGERRTVVAAVAPAR
jgi:hypothetical protein